MERCSDKEREKDMRTSTFPYSSFPQTPFFSHSFLSWFLAFGRGKDKWTGKMSRELELVLPRSRQANGSNTNNSLIFPFLTQFTSTNIELGMVSGRWIGEGIGNGKLIVGWLRNRWTNNNLPFPPYSFLNLPSSWNFLGLDGRWEERQGKRNEKVKSCRVDDWNSTHNSSNLSFPFTTLWRYRIGKGIMFG